MTTESDLVVSKDDVEIEAFDLEKHADLVSVPDTTTELRGASDNTMQVCQS